MNAERVKELAVKIATSLNGEIATGQEMAMAIILAAGTMLATLPRKDPPNWPAILAALRDAYDTNPLGAERTKSN